MQTCRKCSAIKSLDNFPVNKMAASGYHSWCKACMSEYNKEHYTAHKEERLKQTDAYRRAHLEMSRACSKKWKETHPVQYMVGIAKSRQTKREYTKKWIANNRERYLRKFREWRHKNREKVIATAHRRRAKVLSLPGKFTGQEWKALKEKYGHRCLRCGKQGIQLTADHVIPVTKGGTNFIDNIQPLCKPCNSGKHVNAVDYRPKWNRRLASESFVNRPEQESLLA